MKHSKVTLNAKSETRTQWDWRGGAKMIVGSIVLLTYHFTFKPSLRLHLTTLRVTLRCFTAINPRELLELFCHSPIKYAHFIPRKHGQKNIQTANQQKINPSRSQSAPSQIFVLHQILISSSNRLTTKPTEQPYRIEPCERVSH